MKIYHTKTQEDFNALMEELESDGVCWKNGVRATGNKVWDWFEKETCVKVDDKVFTYGSIGYYKLEHPDTRIIEYTAKKNKYKEGQYYCMPKKKTLSQAINDVVNSPSHYTQGELEVIDILKDKMTKEEFEGFLKGNILKYTFRENIKNGTEDMKKAAWYTAKLIEFREG